MPSKKKRTNRATTARVAAGKDKDKAVEANASPEDQFPQRLSALRERNGLKHDSLSELTKLVDPQKRGIARTTLRGYELGIYKPGIRELRILSQSLGVTPNELIFGVRNVRLDGASQGQTADASARTDAHSRALELVAFVVAMFNADEATRSTVFRITHDLVRAKLGAVEYERIIGATREVAETALDAYRDDPSAGFIKPDQVEHIIKEFLPRILDKFGIKPVERQADSASPSQEGKPGAEPSAVKPKPPEG